MSHTLRLMARKKGGQPRQYSPETVKAIIDKFARYIDRTDVPIVAEFCYRNHVSRKCIYDYPEFDDVRERCILKKEAQLERLGGTKLWDPGMAKFSLTQLGWSTKQDIKHSGNIDSNVHIYLPSNNRMSKTKPDEDED